MSEPKQFFTHGSCLIRADSHLHTRRDREFKDGCNEQDFVARYVAVLKQADISVGAITNHNKFGLDPFIFAAHNATFPVLGDLEGGPEAFVRRREIYKLWKQ